MNIIGICALVAFLCWSTFLTGLSLWLVDSRCGDETAVPFFFVSIVILIAAWLSAIAEIVSKV